VAEGISRERIAKLIDVSVGSLQVTCSRLGISLRRSGTRCARVLSGPNPLPMVGHMQTGTHFQIILERDGTRRTTELPLTNSDIGRLALEAEARNMSMAQLLTAIATMAVKKDLIEEILREPSQEPAPKAEGA
jgi:hypothetical protein